MVDDNYDIFCALVDCGCDIDFVEQFLILYFVDDTEKMLESLANRKLELLEKITRLKQYLNCLEYLTQQIKQR